MAIIYLFNMYYLLELELMNRENSFFNTNTSDKDIFPEGENYINVTALKYKCLKQASDLLDGIEEAKNTQQKSYFNTTKETGQLLLTYETIAKGQETDILSVFNVGDMLTPYEVEFKLSRSNKTMLIGSVKRGLTTLTGKGLLTKNSEMKLGAYGRKNYTWSLK